MNLSEDLTGLVVSSFRLEEGQATYVCILNDCLGRVGALNFKLRFDDQGATVYEPDVQPARDTEIAAVLPDKLQKRDRCVLPVHRLPVLPKLTSAFPLQLPR